MPKYSFIQCDVFTDRAFGGNPLAVLPEASGIDDATMQRIAREMNLSETVFVLPPSDEKKALRRLRIFTPNVELPMAGHPVVGCWYVLAREGVVAPPASGNGAATIHQELKVGILPVAIEFADGTPVRVVMTQPPSRIGPPLQVAEEAARALSLDRSEISVDPIPLVVAVTGIPFLMVQLRTRAAMKKIVVNQPVLNALVEKTEATGIYVFTLDTGSADVLATARMFGGPGVGIDEDPATGSAAGPFAATLVHYGLAKPSAGVARFTIEQGVDMGRPSYIEAEVEGEAGDARAVRIAGSSVILIRGEIEW